MTELVNPSINRVATALETAGSIAYAGGSVDGYIQQANTPSDISVKSTEINEGNLNAFAESHSASSFDLTVDAGEAFIYGAWVVTDEQNTVTIPADETGYLIYLGWDIDGANNLIIGDSSSFNTDDPKIQLYSVNTDGSGITDVNDNRRIGRRFNAINTQYDADANGTVDNSEEFDGQTPAAFREDTYVRKETATLPQAELEDGESLVTRVHVPSGTTFKAYTSGVQDDSGNVPSGLQIQAYDDTNSTSIYQGTAKRAKGTPLASKSGTIDVKVQVNNNTGGIVNASGYIGYVIE